ncbi:hypothetical protein BDV27DRAFT_139214 [Aspergillus caelatus]|uniref:Uncharacterized protein n=1 Tax=Aspergillus caelatus TaxID=61420 RepID=A0A5N6ZKM9_9EURO|nr:uncharacterized protein BDV27DRAFT_139214 [Aspergillus caelatus]KAE8357516.1 hypothetical protein BDV27DRAFT_139214 [Aspergillus caelatus]
MLRIDNPISPFPSIQKKKTEKTSRRPRLMKMPHACRCTDGISTPHLVLIISFLLFRCDLSMVRLGPDDQNAPGIVSSAPSVHASIRSILPLSHWLTSPCSPIESPKAQR